MSRIPQRPPRSPVKSNASVTSPSSRSTTPVAPRTRTKSTAKPMSTPSKKNIEPEDQAKATPLSIKEAIALKRAEAKKAQKTAGSSVPGGFSSWEDAVPDAPPPPEEDVLGRASVKETIERARSTGSLNLSTRSLPCIPSALFDIHLGITPDPLKSLPDEPPLPEGSPTKRTGKSGGPAWYESQDLRVLKAWGNEIQEIQHEISLFGSLQIVDLHSNKITALPETFADLLSLTSLDLSHNNISSLPPEIFSLPELIFLDISHNNFNGIPFNEPFISPQARKTERSSFGFFSPQIKRAESPLPKLRTLNASHNQIVADKIDARIPVNLTKVDLSSNPLEGSGPCSSLLQRLATLSLLKELLIEKAEISDAAFSGATLNAGAFPVLKILHLGETQVSREAVQTALKHLNQELTFDLTSEEPPDGVLRVIVGKQVIREAWEIEAERRTKARTTAHSADQDEFIWGAESESRSPQRQEAAKEPWEIEAEQVLTEGAKRRMRAQAAAAQSQSQKEETRQPVKPQVVEKEAWEIEAEQGLLTEGGRRRARVMAASSVPSNAKGTFQEKERLGMGPPPSRTPSPGSPTVSMEAREYYNAATLTLTLPPTNPPSKSAGHTRAFSFAATSALSSATPVNAREIGLPAPSLPFAEIHSQSFARTLTVLVLKNRRLDVSVTLPSPPGGEPWLPSLEELDLEGCNLKDTIPIAGSPGSSPAPRPTMPLLTVIASVSKNLRVLNLAYNFITSASLTSEALSALILASDTRSGLKRLELRGNRIDELDGFQAVASNFRANRQVPEWKLDELDLRDNEIGKLPPELGLLPLEVFLVDGNTFRVPQRRIWEREGTKGLLSWLRGRIE